MRKQIIISVITVLSCFSCDTYSTSSTHSATAVKDSLQEIAFHYYSGKDYDNALKYLDTLIKLDSTNGEYYYKRAVSNGRLIKKKEAIRDFSKSAILGHRVDDSYWGIGLSYAFDNDSLCLVYLNKIKAINPRFQNIDIEIRDCEKRIVEFRSYEPLYKEFKERNLKKSPQQLPTKK